MFETIKTAHAEQGAGRSLIQVVVPRSGNGALLGGLSGLVKTANRESTRVFAQLVEGAAADDLATMLDADSRSIDDHVRYDGGIRHVMQWREREFRASSLPWKENGVYLVTGGSGGLGQVFARHIARQAPTARIILCGRRQQVDVGRRDQVDAFIADVMRSQGRIDGVLHCAGLLRDNYIARKSATDFAEVLAPKVAGTLHLDAATGDLDLDFFALFSSAAGALGSAGQADYAAANAFLDAFAHHRNAQVDAGSRRGRTVSIDWPLWAEGGMRMEPAAEQMMRQTTGMEALPSALGVRAFEEILASGVSQALVLYGSPARLRRSIAAPDAVVRTEDPRSAGTAERRGRIEQMLLGAVAALMKFELAELDVETEWSQYGFDSISLTEFSNKLNQQHRLELTPTVFFEYPTIGALATWLADSSDLFPAPPTPVPTRAAEPRIVQPSAPVAAPVQREAEAADAVAIIGMSGRFPMARDIEEFWTNLRAGRDCISEIPSDRWDWKAQGDEPRWGGFIDGIGNFDARFFGISPREAEQMDPQQRLLMEYAWKAIEDAGYAPASLSGSNTALFVGTASSGYGNLIMQSGAAIEGYSSTAVVGSIGPNRMSYFLNLHGPSEPIETACSSSLVAIHRALSAMAAGDCDQAIVGGINLILSPETHTSFAKAGMLCPDGRCKTFSRHANGYVRGEGVGMLFLKKLRAAERDGDHIYGVIRGSAENHGGRANSLTAPNPKAQAELLKRAYTRAGVDPRTVGYIEAHGTGTELGDPIEVNGLKTAFRDFYASTGSGEITGAHCGVGSVKSNIGHLELAAGVAGVIKVLLQLRHRTLVPTLHCDEVNPYIQLQGSPFYLVRENREWMAPRDPAGRELPRRAGVSSFGFGGVNAHVVIEEYAPRQEVPGEWPSPGLVVLSAKTAERLKESAAALLAFVKTDARPGHDDALVDKIRDLTAEILRVDADEIDAARPLEEYGVDVLQRSMLGSRLAETLGVEIDAVAILRERTIVAIAGSLLKQPPAPVAAGHSFRLENLAYTLQVGRDAMDERLAIVASSIQDLESKLQAFVDGAMDGVADLFTGQARQNKSLVAAFGADEELQEALEKWIQRGKFSKLLDLWTKGLAVDWEKLYGEAGPFPWKPRRISLPGYSFAAQRHWIKPRAADPEKRKEKAPPPLPPLVQDNIAALTGSEFFLADHRVQGRQVLPGVAHLEMMRAAASHAGTGAHPPGEILRLKDVVWIKPAIVEEPKRLRVDLTPGPHGGSRCVISSDGETHSEGTVLSIAASQPQLDLAALRAQSGWKRFDADACYRLFGATGLDYGPAHRGIAELHVGAGQVLARLVLPQAVAGTLGRFILHPSLLDSALQASIGFALGAEAGEEQPAKLALPFAVETVDVFGPCTAVMWARVRRPPRSSPNDRLQKLDVDLCDEDGRVRVRISGFSSRLLARAPVALLPTPMRAEPADLKAQTITWFKELLVKELGFPIDEIDEGEALDSYGIDSRMAMELTRALEKPFGELSKTLFFEHHTLAELVDYFLEVHRPKLLALFDRVAPLPAPPAARLSARPLVSPVSRQRPDSGALDIAIIGLSGRYPQSPDVEAFWRNLRDGKDCITEVPADRWDWRAYYSEDRNEADRHYCRWGGFIADVDKFDPLFFNISPGAAEYIDPQERVFLEHAWMAMEDAGYRREDLHKPSAGAADDELPGQVGVYAGVMYGEYQMVGLEARLKGQGAALASFYASVANRVSHVLDLHGPSMAVDTMCSSSLTAIHLACQDLKLGRTDFALAGGVNLNLHPNKYSLLSQGQYISSNGRCESFGAGGDGYVPSEGVGVVMLKRLADAERDGDHIYGVIKSSALNHGGRTNGYSVPNPKAQQAVIGRALCEARIDPRAIGYVEAHGTGTRLGDPIEITGLAKALGGEETANGACWIGSSKSNIGHCEAAAGIAGLTKILLQMREGEIAPSLHAETLNPNIDFTRTPFQLNRELREWSRPIVDGQLHRRAAGVSSFGAGGANAHLIIEEYVGTPAAQPREPATANPCLVVLSAKSEEQLRQYAGRLREFVEAKDAAPLRDIAYTLQVGREAMPQRLAFNALSLQEMAGKLARFLRGDHAGLLAGRAKAGAVMAGDDPLAAWIKGAEIDWLGLYDENDRPARVSLPTYPFARERYWASHAEPAPPAAHRATNTAPVIEKALTLRPMWRAQATSAEASTAYSEHWVLSAASLPEIAGATIVRLDSSFIDRAVQLFERIKTILQSRPRAPVLVQVVVEGVDRLDAGLAGLLRTARMENPQLVGQLIELDSASGDDVATLLRANGQAPADPHVRYRQGRREVMGWAELADGTPPTLPVWRQGGTYLIVGGAGGLGLHFAHEIARQVNDVTLILTGRSRLDGKRLADVEALKALGARVEYRSVDVADGAAVRSLIATISGPLNGIVHSAGVLRDGYILKKTATDFRDVLASKVLGAVNLDAASERLDLDFFILFSSLAGAVGNPGQADYATANAFLDAFAADRTRRGRSGRTLSINWPLWQDGGMGLDVQSRELMWQRTGLEPLHTGTGIEAFYRALHSSADQVVVLQGDVPRLRQSFLSPPTAAPEALPEAAPMTAAEDSDELTAKVQGMLVKMLADMLKIPLHRIEIDVPLEEYGIDSVAMMKLGSDLEKILGPLPKTLFYEHPSVEAASSFIVESCRSQLAKLFDVAPPSAPKAAPVAKAPIVEAPVAIVDIQDIAVVGMAGRFPMASDIDEFWRNLVQGRDCITEVPAERWDHSLYFDPDKDKPGKTYCKWGGFLDEVDRFDARFFRISPSEAELLDPQERLFLETSWTLLESSGYLGETLQRLCQSKVGVFVGSMSQQYHAVESDPVREAVVVLSSPSSIANRVSYFFNFQGPSIAIDTMCSSALNAVHMACDSLRRGDCKLAIAGGVNLTIHPKKYVGLSVGQMVGSHPGCTSFGDGDGYLPAEAVGAVLLKPLRDAIADGDEILAVIKSTAVNHGGQSSGYRVPSAAAQTELIAGNFARAGIDPRSVSYVESAANGSAMGDAIELRALAAAFARFTRDRQFCAIGSVKSNIGHAEAASGVTQLIKVILQLKHRQLVPTIKARPLNPDIAFEETPFYLQRTLEEWRRPDGGKRRASISSFGAGGSNAHLIVEEYEGERAVAEPADGRQLILLSAKTRLQLESVTRRLLAFIEGDSDLAIADLAYTLQTAREPMDHRLAFVVESRAQLIEALRAGPASPKLFTGDAAEDNSDMRQLLSGKAGRTMLDMLLAERDLEKLALYWTKGVRIAWQPMHAGRSPRRIALPTYPLDRQSHWLAAAGKSAPATFVSDARQPLEDNVRRYVAHALGELLGVAVQTVDSAGTLQDHGVESMAAAKLRRGLEQTFGVKLSASDMLTCSDLAALVRLVAERQTTPLSEGQKGLWLLHQLAPQTSAYNVPMALRLPELDIELLQQACAHMLRRFPILASVFGQRNGEPFQRTETDPRLAFEHERIGATDEATVVELLRARSKRPFDLEHGPLFRVHVISPAGGASHVLLVVHHIVFDGSSAVVLVRSLAAASPGRRGRAGAARLLEAAARRRPADPRLARRPAAAGATQLRGRQSRRDGGAGVEPGDRSTCPVAADQPLGRLPWCLQPSAEPLHGRRRSAGRHACIGPTGGALRRDGRLFRQHALYPCPHRGCAAGLHLSRGAPAHRRRCDGQWRLSVPVVADGARDRSRPRAVALVPGDICLPELRPARCSQRSRHRAGRRPRPCPGDLSGRRQLLLEDGLRRRAVQTGNHRSGDGPLHAASRVDGVAARRDRCRSFAHVAAGTSAAPCRRTGGRWRPRSGSRHRRAFPAAGTPDAGRHGVGLRRPVARLPRARRAEHAARLRAGQGRRADRRLPSPRLRDDRRHARDLEGGCGLCPARAGMASAASSPGDRRQRHAGADRR
ncbi:MAG: SDR family NAD(P)-dependent oxidoreductase, partial [Alphaproteobacteria bacterium]|nr:SDR family NAD(P)-dependent oxidoreductase [Alphaproteobacteria bacterium]